MFSSALVFFFFSSRRRHTRCSRDWSSDVSSSDPVLVDAGVALRRTRLRAMRGLSNDEADRMIAAQMPAERKRAKSDLVIENEGSLEQLERQARARSEEHTSELQSRLHLVCRLLLEKKKTKK